MAQASFLLLGTAPLPHRSCRRHLRAAQRLAGLCRRYRLAALQRRRRLLAGQQGGECACGVEEGFGAARPRLARQPMGHGRRRRACTRRYCQRYRGSNRSGRSYPDRWQVSELRSGVADRRVVAGCEEGRRRGLFGQHRQTRGDDGRGHRDRQQDLLRPHREACRRGGLGFPFAARGDAGRRLSAAARLGSRCDPGRGAVLSRADRRRCLELGRIRQDRAVRSRSLDRIHSGRLAGGHVRNDGDRRLYAVAAKGNRVAPLGD